MSRGNTAAVDAEIIKPQVRVVRFVELEFSTPLRLWTGLGDLTWDSKTWSGAGDLMGFGTTQETTEIRANGKSITLTGVPADLISLALSEDYQGNPARVWVGFLDASGSVIADPIQEFTGVMDTMAMSDDGQTASFELACENALVALERVNVQNYTSQRQKIDYPTDKGFDQVPQLQDLEITWGRG